MTKNNKFQALLKAGKLQEAFFTALAETVKLEITTWLNSRENPQTQASPNIKVKSNLNLLQNKIDYEMGEELLKHRHAKTLQDFHNHQVSEASLTRQNNLQTLEKLFAVLADLEHPGSSQPLFAQPMTLTPIAKVLEEEEEEIEEDDFISDILQSFEMIPEEVEIPEASVDIEIVTETESVWEETSQPDVELAESLLREELGQEQESDEGWDDWELESPDNNAVTNFETEKAPVSWRTLQTEAEDMDSGTESDWDELDSELNLESDSPTSEEENK